MDRIVRELEEDFVGLQVGRHEERAFKASQTQLQRSKIGGLREKEKGCYSVRTKPRNGWERNTRERLVSVSGGHRVNYGPDRREEMTRRGSGSLGSLFRSETMQQKGRVRWWSLESHSILLPR